MYETFHILIDDPAPKLALGFDDYAGALTEIVRLSRPQFAVGIFGAWGSGKTTLMRAVSRDLEAHPETVPIWFNAWRYEREEHLIVPLLDTIREQVLEWAGTVNEPESINGARRLATAFGRAAKAILAGVSMTAGIAGAVEVSLDANRVAAEWARTPGEESPALEPKSFYHASFKALEVAVTEFFQPWAHEDNQAPPRRFVVFVDDLDRCLPESAVQVLEAMKLFFDLSGFVFVVGLDQAIIERAVEHKYSPSPPAAAGNYSPHMAGTDYIKKIFQVQLGVPRVDEAQLGAYIDAFGTAGDLLPAQRDDLLATVLPALRDLVSESGRVNPREVKRLVNAYTLQLKILERKLGPWRVTPEAVIALQIFGFRSDWRSCYDAFSNNPVEFADGVRGLTGGETTIAVAAELIELPPSLLSFLQGAGASILNLNDELELYVSALESARTTDPRAREVSQALSRLRVALSRNGDAAHQTRELLSELASMLAVQQHPAAADAARMLLALADGFPTGTNDGDELDLWTKQVAATLPALAQTVADLRRRSTTADSAA